MLHGSNFGSLFYIILQRILYTPRAKVYGTALLLFELNHTSVSDNDRPFLIESYLKDLWLLFLYWRNIKHIIQIWP